MEPSQKPSRIRIEAPAPVMLTPEEAPSQKLSFFYVLLLLLTYLFSGVGVYLSFLA